MLPLSTKAILPHSWKETLGEKGVLIDIDTNEILVEGLEMPHSPRLFGDDLYVLQSRNGAISKVDTKTGQLTEVRRLNYFVRGMDKVGDYLFVGFLADTQKFVDIRKTRYWRPLS
jgi:uncharacterized protein (TIGR03032 family)